MTDGMKAPVAVLAAGEGELVDVFGAPMVVKLDPALHGAFLAEQVAPPGYLVPPHIHAEDDEAFVILEGTLTLFDGSGERTAGPGETVRLPRGSRHGFRNAGPAPARFLVMAMPGRQLLAMFREFDRAAKAAGPAGLQPPEIVRICAAHGVTMG